MIATTAFDPLAVLRKADQERYIACLYLPEEVRSKVATLYAFDAEIARIPELISEPMPGEIRLQFWRDLIAKGNDGEQAGPLGEALLSLIVDANLPRETFHNYLNARIFDLYNDPMPDAGTLEGYIGETHAALFHLASLINGAKRSTQLADACGHAGMVFGISRLIGGLAWHHTQKRCYIPQEMLTQNALSLQDWFGKEQTQAHLNVLHQFIDLGLSHLEKANSAIKTLEKDHRSVFVPLAFVKPKLESAKKAGLQSFKQPIVFGPLKSQWLALRWALGRR